MQKAETSVPAYSFPGAFSHALDGWNAHTVAGRLYLRQSFAGRWPPLSLLSTSPSPSKRRVCLALFLPLFLFSQCAA